MSGIVFVGDIRDAGVYISQGDRQMALVCLAGLVPTGGDGARYISKIGKGMAEYSAENAAKVSAKIEFRRTAVEAIAEPLFGMASRPSYPRY
ncbi:MAG: hypothetical protein KO254_12840 [Methanoculleus marisnigri]|uniref:hypothetical protein n=1 Tax=Methanoculleus sp. MH98A TaxID=1495314 RepID=UPI0004A137B0|nr:hypothetical protein [Methanoculleus sp. MH98A]KDE55668.1 hypothetical protein EI28_05825 [Methanoculleus sp. MH98A]MCC7556971.1 hypothetical protein [Methanoculleus marisnigri]MDK2989449.1 hypothetical protein [Methanoculleus sp.]